MNAPAINRIVCTACLAMLLVSFGVSPEARAAEPDPALSTADLFVDLARDHGLNCRGTQTANDVLYIKTLLRAAVRLDPRQTQACVWLYELTSRGDQPDQAADFLAKLVAADPNNISAFGTRLETGPRRAQTVEQRQAWLTGLLSRPQPPKNLALLHTHLARIAWQQVDHAQAHAHLNEALQLWPECPDALLLALQFVTPDLPPARRLEVALPALRANPLQADLAWQVALLLDENGFADQALTFYDHALSVHTTTGLGQTLLPEQLTQLSRNALTREDLQAAIDYARRASQTERGTYEAHFYLHWILAKDDLPDERAAMQERLAQTFADIKDPTTWPVGIVSQAAWFYCIIDPQPQRALMLAEDAATRAPGDLFVTRVLGWAHALNGHTEQARATLEPIASADPYATCQLARLLRDAGDPDAPARLLNQLAHVPTVGHARDLLDELGAPLPTSQSAAQRLPEITTLLATFDQTVLEFHQHPTRFLKANIEFENRNPRPGEPWWATFSLTNHANFPITLGPDWMLNPVFLLSFQIEGDRKRDFPNLMTVSLDHARVIRPGQTLSIRRTIDVGPLRRISRRTPQHLQAVSVSAILDPQQTADGWQPSPTGLTLRPAALVRLPANTDPQAWHARFAALRRDPPQARFQTLEVMAELLGEQQRAAAKPLAYKPQPIPAERVHQTLRAALESDSWETRVRALDSLQVAGLDRPLVDAARRCLEHPHWAVRMMAVRLLARQGKAFAPTATRVAAEDQDELVRDIAHSYAQRWSPTQPQPVTQPQNP